MLWRENKHKVISNSKSKKKKKEFDRVKKKLLINKHSRAGTKSNNMTVHKVPMFS